VGIAPSPEPITLFLAGDVMLGRGVDQVFPESNPPGLHEPYCATALTYVELAEKANGPIPRPVDHAYIWGQALAELDRMVPDARIVNLETSITTHEGYDETKWIHYRMHPANLPCLAAADVSFAVLANNHVLDWSEVGLLETLENLEKADIATAGAGRDARAAAAPAVVDLQGKGRVIVVAFGFTDSGIPSHWAAGPGRPGVALLPDFSDETVSAVAALVRTCKQPGDVVVASVHWGGNWGYAVPADHRRFARHLVDRAGVDLVHGHSSHHPRPLEVYEDRLILYGCGDFLNDYEGIRLYERYRGDLVLMYFPKIDPSTGKLLDLQMSPLRIRRFRLERAPFEDVEWLRETLDRECRRFGNRVSRTDEGRLALRGS
jgi:poly-gamma-glutamate synthesis protein (capsule biosynthesis protein)